MALGTADEDWRVASALTAALGFVSVACLWWVYFDRGMAGGLSSRHRVDADLHPHPHPAPGRAHGGRGRRAHAHPGGGDGNAQAGAAWALDGGAALYLLCLTVAQHATDRGAGARAARALAGIALVVLAALAGALTPVSLVACSAAALLALVVYEIRLGLAEQDA